MNTLEDRLTNALDRRGADVHVRDDLDAIVDDTNIVKFAAEHPRRGRSRRLLTAAAAVTLLAAGTVAVTQLGGNTVGEQADEGTATQPDVPDDGAVLPVPFASVDSLADDEWVIPTRLPDGFDYQYAADTSAGTSSPQMVLYGMGASQIEQIVLNRGEARRPLGEGTALDVNGVEWIVRGTEGSRTASRRVGDDVFTIGGRISNNAELTDVLASLVVVTDVGLPAPPLDTGAMTQVGVFEFEGRELTLSADGSDGWFCTGATGKTGSTAGCASFFDPAEHLEQYQFAGGGDYAGDATGWRANVDGKASAATARVEVEWIDGTVTEVEPKNTSGRFPDVRFWATGTTIDLEPGQTAEQFADTETVVEVRAFDADGALLATSRNGTLTVE